MSDDQRPSNSETTRAESGGDTTRQDGGKPEGNSSVKRLGDFDLLREIGRGGMGVVYEARQISLKRRVALKVLPPALGMSAQAKQRFEREAQAAAKLHHTNIVPVHAVGEHDGHHFYAMDLIEGQSLDHVLHQVIDEGTNALMEATVTQTLAEIPLRPSTSIQEREETSLSDTSAGGREWIDTVAKLMAEVADGLHYAHGRGVIHRDIKPANLMLSKEGHLCVTDFGLARVLQEPGITVTGSFLGTPAYMSPEQISAGRIKVDHRTDVYSLGVVLYEMLTLQRPFPGESREEILNGVLTKEPRSPRRINGRIPVDLETICLKALEKEPDRRYSTAAELASDLRQYLQHGLIAARRERLSTLLVQTGKPAEAAHLRSARDVDR
jgi:serine/threonine protein kinase